MICSGSLGFVPGTAVLEIRLTTTEQPQCLLGRRVPESGRGSSLSAIEVSTRNLIRAGRCVWLLGNTSPSGAWQMGGQWVCRSKQHFGRQRYRSINLIDPIPWWNGVLH